jgi:phosphoribosyl-ATP pyrophosphohydrolase/phosphoribosyl-AMP cyclohydrolase
MNRDDGSLVPVIVQDARTNNVLMLAFANGRALAKTRKTGLLHFWSRSRGTLWKKGETSGNVMRVLSLARDCDRDAILARVKPAGPACHKGTYSCFSAKAIPSRGILGELEDVVSERRRKPKKGSYTTTLLKDPERRLKKFLEEASELVLAAMRRKRGEIVLEAADVLYHLMVLLGGSGVKLEAVERELQTRGRRRRGR